MIYKALIFSLALLVCFVVAQGQSKTKQLFPINENDKGGFIDNTGKIIIPLKFEWVSDFSDGFAQVKLDNKLGFINQKGKIVFFLPPYVNYAHDFADGLAAIKVENKWGYIDKSGKIVIQPIYDYAWDFNEEIAHVQLRINSITKDAYIDKKGNIVIDFRNFNYLSFADGLAFDTDQNAFIDRKGNIVISRDSYTDAEEFSEGLVSIEIKDKWGFINKTGDTIIAPQFDWAGNFLEGLAPVRFDKWNVKVALGKFKGEDVISNAYGYIDKSGKIVIKPQFIGHEPPYDDNLPVGNFSEGLAKVEDVFSHKWGYINRSGEIVIEPQFDEAGDFFDGVALVVTDDKEGYIDKTGKYIWQAKD